MSKITKSYRDGSKISQELLQWWSEPAQWYTKDEQLRQLWLYQTYGPKTKNTSS